MMFEPLKRKNLTDDRFVEEVRRLTTWPVRMNLPLPSGKQWVDTGGGVDKLMAGDRNVRLVEPPAEPLGLKAYWHVNPLTDLFGSLKGKRVMDIGCGVGYVSLLAAKRGASVVATEMQDASIQRTELVFDAFGVNDNVSVVKADMQTMTVDDMGRYDAILFLGTIYHCEHPQEVLARVAQMTDTLIIDSRLATPEQVNEQKDGMEFFVEEYDDKPQLDSIRRVGGGILRKPTRRTLWKMLKEAGYNSISQTMPYEGMADQFQTENFVQFVAQRRDKLRSFDGQ